MGACPAASFMQPTSPLPPRDFFKLTRQWVAVHAQRSEHSPRGPLGWQRALKTVADQDELVEGGQSSQSGPGGRERACMCHKRGPGGGWGSVCVTYGHSAHTLLAWLPSR